MRHWTALVVAGSVLFGSGICLALEPTYRGQYGNPEEPALRPYKWLWYGAKALAYNTAKSCKDGNVRTPVIGTVEIGRGLRRGTIELGYAAARGAVFSPVPEKGSVKRLNVINQRIEDDWLIQAFADLAFTGPAFPVLKAHDHNPLVTEQQAEDVKSDAKDIRDAQKASRAARAPDETAVKRAQKRYIGDRASYGESKARQSNRGMGVRGNLLKSAD